MDKNFKKIEKIEYTEIYSIDKRKNDLENVSKNNQNILDEELKEEEIGEEEEEIEDDNDIVNTNLNFNEIESLNIEDIIFNKDLKF